MFEIGKEYRNRNGQYVVLSIQGSSLRIRYHNGSEATLNATVQERIISNMVRDNSPNPPGEATRSDQIAGIHHVAITPDGGRRREIGTPPSRSWNRYDLWNKAIFEFFFNRQMSNQLVYIDVDDDVIDSLSPDETAKNSPTQDFIQTVKSTLGSLGNNLLDPHLAKMDSWKSGGRHAAPPFLGLLACFCLAAQRMQSDAEYGSSNYYVRLAQILVGSSYQPSSLSALD